MIKTSGNPALKKELFRSDTNSEAVMSTASVFTKVLILSLITFGTAIYTWTSSVEAQQAGELSYGGLIGASLAAFIIALIIVFKPYTANVLAPVYSVFKGVLLGTLSLLAEMRYPGIAIQAVVCTGSVFMIMLFIYRTGLIRVTNKVRSIIIAATFGILISYLITFVMSLFGFGSLLFQSSVIGIVFSLVVAGVAAFNLLLDFDFIDQAAAAGAPKKLEWYASFSLLVTIIWLYISILRLLLVISGSSRD